MNSEEKQAPPRQLEAAKKRLVEAVARLERELEQGPSIADSEAEADRSKWSSEAAEIEALRSVTDIVATRLDGAIDHLRNVLEK